MTISSGSGSSPMAQMMHQKFKEADLDQSGGLSQDEFSKVLSQASGGRSSGPADKFGQLDVDRDGQLSEREVTNGMKSMMAQMQAQDGFALGGQSQMDLLDAFRDGDDRRSKRV